MLNKAQDAVVELANVAAVRIAKLVAEGVELSDALQQVIADAWPEVKQVLDAAEKIGAVCDAAQAMLNEIRQSAKGVDIDVQTPSGGAWHICVRQDPQKEAEKP